MGAGSAWLPPYHNLADGTRAATEFRRVYSQPHRRTSRRPIAGALYVSLLDLFRETSIRCRSRTRSSSSSPAPPAGARCGSSHGSSPGAVNVYVGLYRSYQAP